MEPNEGKLVREFYHNSEQLYPERTAVVCGDTRLTYRELGSRIRRLAWACQELGIHRGDRVAVLMRNCHRYVEIFGACFELGAIIVPINIWLSSAELIAVLQDAEPRALFVEADAMLEASIAGIASSLHEVGQSIVVGAWKGPIAPPGASFTYDALLAQAGSLQDPPMVFEEDPAVLLYTSGTTGRPKGVVLSNGGIWTQLLLSGVISPVSEETVRLVCIPLFHGSFLSPFQIFGFGGTVVIQTRFDLLATSALIAREGITDVVLLPTLIKQLVDRATTGPGEVFSSLRRIIYGGEPMNVDLLRAAMQAFGCELSNNYGSTEAGSISMLSGKDHLEAMRNSKAAGRLASVGRVTIGSSIRVVDEGGIDAPAGTVGELLVRGPSMMAGYWRNPAATADAFAGGWFHTGDLGYIDAAGYLYLAGRKKDMIISGGENIYAGEVEQVLERHPAVLECAVIGLPDEHLGERVHAFVVLRPGSQATEDELILHCLERIAPYKCPGTVAILREIPKNAMGIVLKRILREQEGPHTVGHAGSPVPRLAAIWQKLLAVEHVSPDANFFALGGNSLLAVQMVELARRAGLTITLDQFRQHQTVGDLASVAGQASAPLADQGVVTGPVRLLPAQHWFLHQSWLNPHHYTVALLLSTPRALNAALVEQALRLVALHHDILRARFEPTAHGWQQDIPEQAVLTVPIEQHDLSGCPQTEQAQRITAEAQAAQARLHLAHGPLMRVALFELGAGQPGRFLLVLHHLLADAVSLRILLEDFYTAYVQLEAGKQVQLPPKTTSAQHWADRLATFAHSSALHPDVAYWTSLPWNAVPPLPLDMPAGVQENTVGSRHTVMARLSVGETRALFERVLSAEIEITDVLLAALLGAWVSWTGFPLLYVSMIDSGRMPPFAGAEIDLSRTVGLLTLLRRFLLQASQDTSPQSLLRAIRSQVRSTPNRGLGFDLLAQFADDDIQGQSMDHADSHVLLNYLGRLEQLVPSTTFFRPAAQETGPEQDPREQRNDLLECVAWISEGYLQLQFQYSERCHHPSTIQRVASSCIELMQALLPPAGASPLSPQQESTREETLWMD